MARTAVVLFNLGGPDSLIAVRPFLYNLFSDPAIIGLPTPFRQLLAWVIAKRRTPVAEEIYKRLGGSSPLYAETRAQATALEQILNEKADGTETMTFIAMRYWHPMVARTAAAVKEWRPDRVVLLPLYPQFSTTSTGSSLASWAKARRRVGLDAPEQVIERYPELDGMITAQAKMIDTALTGMEPVTRILFSAHGLPKRVVARGDTYPDEVMLTARAIAKRLAVDYGRRDADWRVCYQSRVGPVAWIGPYTDDEIRRAGAERRPLVVVPIAFVSEHSETLVELDMDYKRVADAAGVPNYVRVPALGTHPDFIHGLAGLIKQALS